MTENPKGEAVSYLVPHSVSGRTTPTLSRSRKRIVECLVIYFGVAMSLREHMLYQL